MSEKHTKLPWHVDQYGGVVTNSLDRVVVNGFAPSSGPRNKLAEENTTFIIRACNAHDELVAQLKALLNYADSMHRLEASQEGREVDYETFPLVRAAIAKATGEQP